MNRARAQATESSFAIPSLDGIRAVAVALVFFGHAGISASPSPLGVTVFFFLSGFLITTLLRMEFDRRGSISFRAFYLRRALRILPPLYLVLAVACLLTAVGVYGAQKLRVGALLAQAFYLSNYQILQSGWDGPHSGRPLGTGDFWSLAVEEHFYLVFPFLYVFLRRYLPSVRRQVLVLLGICAAVLFWRVILIWWLHASFDRTYAASDTRLDSILFGCILAVWGNPVFDAAGSGARSAGALRRLWAPILAPVGLVCLYLSFRLNDVRLAGTVQYTLQGLALVPVFIVAVRYHRWGVFKLLNLRWVKFVGALSYSIYLMQQIIITGVHRHLQAPHLIHGVVYIGVTLALSVVMYRVVEQPCARLRRRLSRIGIHKELKPDSLFIVAHA